MNLAELINQNVSKKWGVAIVGIITLAHIQAPSWQIMVIAAIAVIMQGILDLKKPKVEGEQK